MRMESMDRNRDADTSSKLYVRAIAGLRRRIETLSQKGLDEGLKDSIEVLACIVQLILLKVSFLEILLGIRYGRDKSLKATWKTGGRVFWLHQICTSSCAYIVPRAISFRTPAHSSTNLLVLAWKRCSSRS